APAAPATMSSSSAPCRDLVRTPSSIGGIGFAPGLLYHVTPPAAAAIGPQMSTSSPIQRRPCVQVRVGPVTVGGDAPVVVQSMTNTDTADEVATAVQVAQLARAGSEIVRITVNTEEAAAAVPRIRDRLDAMGLDVPLVGDFHFNGHRLLEKHPACAEALAKLRINPGNVGRGKKRDPQFAAMIEFACRYDKPVRIGVNWGSLDQDLLARMLDDNAKLPQPRDLAEVMREAVIQSA